MLELKEYQRGALEALGEYCRLARRVGAKRAFLELTSDVPYHPVPGLPDLPYVCLRVPTGGGKTLMAAHAVGLLTKELLLAEHSVVLWLAPTKEIVGQTLRALKEVGHPYHDALKEGLGGGAVTVLDLGEALSVQRATLEGSTTIIVSTLAALRVTDTEGRKIYESNGSLMSHFSGLTEAQKQDLEREVNGGEETEDEERAVAYSLANVLRLRRPLVIMDEAHNARTSLSFETLERFAPSCVLEFTATPLREHVPDRGKFASNVLVEVNAAQLKAERMIKMPIRLETEPDWRATLVAALRKRAELEAAANAEEAEGGQYLRPILLVQAQPTYQDRDSLNVEVVEKALLEEKVPAEWIRRATGQDRGIQGLNLFAPGPVRVLITVRALAEGWDCSFAYVLCSLAEIGSPKDVEQVLGRIMRLPGAREHRREELNCGYAFIASTRFSDVARCLRDSLVEYHGFEPLEAEHSIASTWPLPWEEGLFGGEAAPAQRGVRLAVPVLARREQGVLDIWESEDFLDVNWCLAQCPAELSEQEFPSDLQGVEEGQIDVGKSGVLMYDWFLRRAAEQVALLSHEKLWTVEHLAVWLDRNYEHPDVSEEHSRVFCRHAVEYLISERGFSLAELTARRFGLRDAVRDRVATLRREAKVKRFGEVVQGRLLEGEEVYVGPERVFAYPGDYPAKRPYRGPVRFQKHYYETIEHMNDEEVICAQVVDHCPAVKYWVRNLEKRPDVAFWLPTTGGRFYPDFVAWLEDGRYLVVEYKGALTERLEDTKEKSDIGSMWAEASGGECLFYLATKENYLGLDGWLAERAR